ncbi:MAG: hypothetical protein D6757_10115 [Alphaproteobacteria bacterium]|nr:MAG: hypothetical protein D6757_10115 [Alphaproteobacteria bacterium]
MNEMPASDGSGIEDRHSFRPAVRAAGRMFARGLLLLILGLVVAAAIQVGFNILRYMIQPDWLVGRRFRLVVALTGLLAAAALAFFLARLGRREPAAIGSARLRFLLVLMAVLPDPYYLAYLGWQAAPEFAELLRYLQIVLLLIAFVPPPGGESRWARLPALIAAMALYGARPRFWLVPALPGDMETAAMAPIHLLVFAKAVLLALLAAAAIRMAGALAAGRKAGAT